MRALLIALLALSAVPALAQEAPVATAPLQSPIPSAAAVATDPVPVVPAPPALASGASSPPVVPAPPAAQGGVVSADEAVDPLADLIAQSGPQTTDEEEAPVQAPRHRPTILPIPAPEPDAARPDPSISGSGAMPIAEAYDLRVKGSILAAQGLQGPLDGGWAVAGPDGAVLYTLQIVDPVGGYGGLEGAWRDMRRVGAVGSTGLIDFVDRSSGDMLVRFSPRAGQLSTLALAPRGDGSWSGKLNENGVETSVVARRVAQAALPPGYVPAGRGPVIWPRPASAAPRLVAAEPARAAACSTKGKRGKALKAAKAKCAAAARKGGKGRASATKGKRGKAVSAKGKGSARGKATVKKKKR